MQLTARLLAVLAVTAVAGFGAAFAVARSGGGGHDSGPAAAPARTTLPSVAATEVDQTIRAVGAAQPLPGLRRRPPTHTHTTTPPATTTQPPPTTTQPPPPTTTQQYRPPPATTQSAPPVTTSG